MGFGNRTWWVDILLMISMVFGANRLYKLGTESGCMHEFIRSIIDKFASSNKVLETAILQLSDNSNIIFSY